MNTEARAPDPAMIIEFLYQVRYGRAVSLNNASKLTSETFLGNSSAVFSVPDGLSAAEMMNTIGNSDQMRATTTRPCRHQRPRDDVRRCDGTDLTLSTSCGIARGWASEMLDIRSPLPGPWYVGILGSSSARR